MAKREVLGLAALIATIAGCGSGGPGGGSDEGCREGAPERCNGLDDDCDGTTDGFTETCGTDEGECTSSLRSCDDGSWSQCDDVGPQDEACDDLDNDCDGDTDEDDVCAPNLGVWCDPADGSGEDERNPACTGDGRCLDLTDGTNGICVVFGCREDDIWTGLDEDGCRLNYGNEYVCIDIEGNNDTDLADNVCVQKCTPSATSNPCESPFACDPLSRRFNFLDTVCFYLGCTIDTDCPVSITDDFTCMSDADCLGATDFCDLSNDTDDDGTVDIGACSEAGNCNTANGLCAPHSLGSPTGRVGDPCQADTDCPNGGTCLNEAPYAEANGVILRSPRNGYCTIFGCKYEIATGAVCPAGSGCYTTFFAGGCMDLCDQQDATGCRDDLDADGDPTGNGTPCDVGMGVTSNCDWYGDYECYDWSGVTFTGSGDPVVLGADGRICNALLLSCSEFFECALRAPIGNPTGMACRDPRTGVASSDDSGRCLDSTTSGDLCPGTWDIDGNCVP